MKFQIKFKSIDHSQSLCDYAADKMARLEKFEIKPVRINVTFSIVRFQKVVEVFIQGVQTSFRAKSRGEDFHEVLNMVMDKLERQMEREKSKVKDHRKPERTHMARLNRALEAERHIDEDGEEKAA
jgi:putative sigma-54 modulation protein